MYQSNLNQVISIQKTNRHKRQIGGNDGASMARVGRYQSKRFFKCALHDVDPNLFVILQLQLLQSRNGSRKATPPPGTMPSSTAARVACIASSTRAFFSFSSVSVAAPT